MPPQGVRWLRPKVFINSKFIVFIILKNYHLKKEVHPEAKFVDGDFDRCDIDQGKLRTIIVNLNNLNIFSL